MTRDDIIRMAREAECEETFGMDAFRFTVEQLERFAALVAAAEREACAQVVEQGHYAETRAGHAAAIRARSQQ